VPPLPSFSAILLTLISTAAHGQLQEQPAPRTRGGLLYENHCGACHSEQMHWRMARRARDWDTLRDQVRKWQAESSLGWSDEDIDAVTRHLNDTIYNYAPRDALAQRRP
jgi:hypothetical protein